MLTLQQIETILLQDVEYAREAHSCTLADPRGNQEQRALLKETLNRFDNFLFRGIVPEDLRQRLQPCRIVPPPRSFAVLACAA